MGILECVVGKYTLTFYVVDVTVLRVYTRRTYNAHQLRMPRCTRLRGIRASAVLLPPHLYGELARTERGCELLRQHGDLKNLLHVARNSHAPADDRIGALWAVVSR